MLKHLALVAALSVAPLAGMPAAFAQAAPPESNEPTEFEEDAEEEVETAEAAKINPRDLGSFGYSIGFDPRTWQFASSATLRHHPWGSFSEAMLGITSRSQALDPTQAYAIESFGINAGLGAQAWFLRLGVMAEFSWLKRVVQDQGKLAFQHSPALLVEPYVGTVLPFLQSPFTSLDARLYVPLGTLAPNLTWLGDPAFGPRVMLTLWFGLPDLTEEDEEDVEEDFQFDEETEEETTP